MNLSGTGGTRLQGTQVTSQALGGRDQRARGAGESLCPRAEQHSKKHLRCEGRK